MSNQFDIRPMVEKHSTVPLARLRVLQSVREVHLPRMRRGIIFIFAAWSGPSVIGLKRFTKAIESLDTRSLDVVILDIDCLTQDFATELYGRPSFTSGGWGETLWIRDGRVIERERADTAPVTLIEQHTRELLDDKACGQFQDLIIAPCAFNSIRHCACWAEFPSHTGRLGFHQ